MQNPHLSDDTRQALTLTELVVVLAILVAVAGLVIPRLGSTTDTARQTVALSSATEVRNAVMQFWSDCKYAYPTNTRSDQRIQLGHLLGETPPPVGTFANYDPDLRLGWNGPYLDSDQKTYTLDSAAGFTTTYGNATQFAIRDPYINQDFDGDGVAESGSPFVIQEPTLLNLASPYSVGELREVRVVSAGPNGILEIDESRFASELEANPSLQGDDIYVSFTLR